MGFGRHTSRPTSARRPNTSRKLSFDSLEDRLVMDVSLGTITAPPVIIGKHTYVPIEITDTQGLPVTVSVKSTNAGIQANVISTGRTLALDVSGKDSAGNAFTGTLLLRLFEDKAPDTIARITQLVNTGFYNGLTFHRVVKGFVAQGGDPAGNGTGGTGVDFSDEFNPSLTFNSFGLLAMANSGDDTNDSQFFTTDTAAGTSFPEHLNFDHTIFGQLVDGTDVLQKIMSTPVDANGKPSTDVKITKAYLINDNSHVVLDLSTTLGTQATGQLTIKATNAKGQTATQTAAVTVKTETTDDGAFLNKIFDRQTPTDTPITFDVSATDLENGALAFVVRNTDFTPLSAAADVTATITQLTNNSARITITPKAGFSGLVNLKIGVTDKLSAPVQTDFDTQAFNLFVTNDPVSPRQLKVVSGAGVTAGNVLNTDTPTIEFQAPAGQTVKVLVNNVEVGVTTQQVVNAADATYRFTLPANKLLLGTNSITAVTTVGGSNSLASAPLTLTFAPSLQQIYVVPGAAGDSVALNFNLLARQSSYKDELGVYVVDDLSGAVNGVAPAASTYRQTVLASSGRQTVFAPGDGTNALKSLTFPAGTKLAFYLVQNRSAATATSATKIFFSVKGANKDGKFHAETYLDRTGNREIYGFEDSYGGGDHDYNDLVFSVRRGSFTAPTVGALAADLAGANTSIKTTFQLLPTNTSRWRPIGGEIGIFPVLDADGSVRAPTAADPNRTLKPSDSGYAQAALSLIDKQVLFTRLDRPSTTGRSITMAGGSLFGVYYVPRGTAQDFLANNPGNTIVAGRPLAYFSFPAANPDGGKVHMRTFPNNGNPRYAPSFFAALNDAQRIHLMGAANGTSANFSDFVLTYQQSLA